MRKEETIIGISPGTRLMGIAVLKNGELIDWKVKSFKGKFTKEKLKIILYHVQNMMTEYGATICAMKVGDERRSTEGISGLISQITALAKQNSISVFTYSLDELKLLNQSDKKTYKKDLMEFTTKRYSMLLLEYRKEKKNHNTYYSKMFEAIVAVHYCFTKMR